MQFATVGEFKKCKIQIEQLKELILRSGGTLKPISRKNDKNENVIKLKNNNKFDRNEADYKITLFESKNDPSQVF